MRSISWDGESACGGNEGRGRDGGGVLLLYVVDEAGGRAAPVSPHGTFDKHARVVHLALARNALAAACARAPCL